MRPKLGFVKWGAWLHKIRLFIMQASPWKIFILHKIGTFSQKILKFLLITINNNKLQEGLIDNNPQLKQGFADNIDKCNTHKGG